jgi:hypothetical protein
MIVAHRSIPPLFQRALDEVSLLKRLEDQLGDLSFEVAMTLNVPSFVLGV